MVRAGGEVLEADGGRGTKDGADRLGSLSPQGRGNPQVGAGHKETKHPVSVTRHRVSVIKMVGE